MQLEAFQALCILQTSYTVSKKIKKPRLKCGVDRDEDSTPPKRLNYLCLGFSFDPEGIEFA
jgi:hypothetical protein